MAVYSVRDQAYAVANKNHIDTAAVRDEDEELNEVIRTLVNHLLTDKTQLILDIEKGTRKRVELEDAISEYIKKHSITFGRYDSYKSVVTAVYDYIFGYRSIQTYIDRLDVSDISIKGVNDAWIKVNGIRQKIDLNFVNNDDILMFARSVAVKNKAELTKANALVRFSDSKTSKDFNLRINIGIEPVNTVCPHIVIRKIPKAHIKPKMDDLLKLNMFDEPIMNYIIDLYRYSMNVDIYGEGGSGKTTLLNAAIEYIPEINSKLCIQEVEELSSNKGNWIFNSVVKRVGEGNITYDLVRLAENGLVLDIDNFIMGENKDAEAMAIIEAIFTGHATTYTGHAPDEKRGEDRTVFNMKKSGTDLKSEDLLRMLSPMDVSIFMQDFKVAGISEITGFDEDNKRITYNPVFKYEQGKFIRVHESCQRFKDKLALQKTRLARRLPHGEDEQGVQ